MDVKGLGRIRKLLEGIDAGSQGDDEQLALTGQLEQLVAPGAAPYRETTRIGRSFAISTTATAIAAVTAIPTVAMMSAIYNNEPDGGRSYVIDWVAASNVVSTNAIAAQAQLLVLPGQVREAIPADGGLVVKKMNGLGSGIDSKVRTLVAGNLPAGTGLATNWIPWGPPAQKPGTAVTPGYGLWASMDGRIIIPPGRYFAMHVISNVTTETFQSFIAWHEVQLTLG